MMNTPSATPASRSASPGTAPAEPCLSVAALQELLREQFPAFDASPYRIEAVEPYAVRMRLLPRPYHLRPGDTVAGPALMTLADTSTYLAIAAMLGREITAVTSSLTIHFLRRPAAAEVVAEARLLRLGRRSAVGEVRLLSAGNDDPVAIATVAYSIADATELRQR